MDKINLTAEGSVFTVEEWIERLDTFPHKMELFDGKTYCYEHHQIAALGFFLENFGVDMAVRIGDPQIWKDAIAKLEEQQSS